MKQVEGPVLTGITPDRSDPPVTAPAPTHFSFSCVTLVFYAAVCERKAPFVPDRSVGDAGNPSVHLPEQNYRDYGSEVGCSRFPPVMEKSHAAGRDKAQGAKI